jgi:type IV pilus assembly protein PilE
MQPDHQEFHAMKPGSVQPAGQAGFTLVEMLVVVAIITLLAAVGYPSYTEYVTRSNRQAGRAMVLSVADRQEQFFLDNKAYAGSLTDLGYPADTIGVARDGQVTGADADDVIYTVTIAEGGGAGSPTTYTIEAEPQGVQATRDKRCGTLWLTHTGQRGADTAVVVEEGEPAPSTVGCW